MVGAGDGARVMIAPSEGRHGSVAVEMLAFDGACADGKSHGDVGCSCVDRHHGNDRRRRRLEKEDMSLGDMKICGGYAAVGELAVPSCRG